MIETRWFSPEWYSEDVPEPIGPDKVLRVYLDYGDRLLTLSVSPEAQMFPERFPACGELDELDYRWCPLPPGHECDHFPLSTYESWPNHFVFTGISIERTHHKDGDD